MSPYLRVLLSFPGQATIPRTVRLQSSWLVPFLRLTPSGLLANLSAHFTLTTATMGIRPLGETGCGHGKNVLTNGRRLLDLRWAVVDRIASFLVAAEGRGSQV